MKTSGTPITQSTGPLPVVDPTQHAILVADSDPASAAHIRTYLEGDNYEVHVNQKGAGIWERIRKLKPDLIVLDMHLSDVDGVAICSQIKRDETLGFLPVILIASDSKSDLRLAGMRSGADDYLVRPVQRREFLARVRALLSTKKRFDDLLNANRRLTEDLAERNRQLEEALQRARDLDIVKGAIVRNVSHELRTPLLQVKSATALLRDEISRASPDANKLLLKLVNMAMQATGRLENTVANITQLAEIQNLRLEPIILNESVDLALRNLRRGWQPKRECERIEKRYGSDIPLALGNKRGIAKVLQHLLDNALKFSPDGGPVEIVITPRDDGTIWIGVQDHGIGIPEDEQDRIFDSFYQVDLTSTRRFGGAGVGLTLANLILSKMNSRIQVESKPGKGSTFSFVLPQAQID